MNLKSFSTQAHQNIVGMSLQAASTSIAALKAAGTTVRVVKPGQVASPLAKVLCAAFLILATQMVSMDYNSNRVNVHVDAAGNVSKVRMG